MQVKYWVVYGLQNLDFNAKFVSLHEVTSHQCLFIFIFTYYFSLVSCFFSVIIPETFFTVVSTIDTMPLTRSLTVKTASAQPSHVYVSRSG